MSPVVATRDRSDLPSMSIHVLENIAEQCYNRVHLRKPLYCKLSRPRNLSKADETALFEYLMAEGWRQQDEIYGVLALVSRSTVSRVLKRNKWTRKEIRRIGSETLRRAYLD